MRYSLAAVHTALTQDLKDAGVATTAEQLARAILMSHLGHQPGFDVLGDAIKDIRRMLGSDHGPALEANKGFAPMVNGVGLPGYASCDLLVGTAVGQAHEQGIGIVGIRHTDGMRSLDVWVRLVAELGFIALMSWSGGSRLVLPPGGIEPVLGTNPIAFAIPTSGQPIVADMATSSTTFRSVVNASRAGTPLPPGVGLDAEGHPTTDPDAVIEGKNTARMLPFGGAKGSALGFLGEVLGGALVGCAMGLQLTRGHNPEEYGGVLIALRPDLWVAKEQFLAEVDALATTLRQSRPIDPKVLVRLPGDKGALAWDAAQRSGLKVSSDDVKAWLAARGVTEL